MSNYVEKSLIKGETVVKKAKKTALFVIMHITNILIIPLIVRIIKFNNIELAITTRRVVGKTGVFSTQALDSPLNKIQNIEISQGLVGKIFNYGTVKITTASGICGFNGIKGANEFKTAILAQADAYEGERIKQQARETAMAMAGVLNK